MMKAMQFLNIFPGAFNKNWTHPPSKQIEPQKKTSYFPLNPGCLIGIHKMVYEIIPI